MKDKKIIISKFKEVKEKIKCSHANKNNKYNKIDAGEVK